MIIGLFTTACEFKGYLCTGLCLKMCAKGDRQGSLIYFSDLDASTYAIVRLFLMSGPAIIKNFLDPAGTRAENLNSTPLTLSVHHPQMSPSETCTKTFLDNSTLEAR